MPKKQATSAAPAASHSRTQITAKAAGERTETRESRRASGDVVSDSAQPLQGLASLNQRTDAPISSDKGDSGGTYAFQPFIFDWYANPVQKNFETLHFVDNKAKAIIGETIAFLHDSETFALLYSKFTDARDEGAKHSRSSGAEGSGPTEYDVDFAMMARCYLAGTLRSNSPLDAIHTIPDGMDGDE